MFKYIWLSILPQFKRTVTFIKSSGRTTLNSVWICLSLMPTFALCGFIPLPFQCLYPLPFQCLVSELLQASPFFYFPIMTQIPFVLAKPQERQEKKPHLQPKPQLCCHRKANPTPSFISLLPPGEGRSEGRESFPDSSHARLISRNLLRKMLNSPSGTWTFQFHLRQIWVDLSKVDI